MSSPAPAPTSKRIATRTLKLVAAGAGIVVAGALTALGAYLFDSATAPPPIHVEVQTNVDQIADGPEPQGGEYWFPSSPSRLTSPPMSVDSCVGRYLWAHAHSGVDAGQTLIRLVIASGSDPVDITGFTVAVKHRQPAPSDGVVTSCPGRGAGGPSQVYVFVADLDASPVTTVSYRAGSETPAPTIAFTLSPHESQILDVIASTHRCMCEWEGRLVTSVDGKPEQVPINDDGHPFVTTARLGRIVRFIDRRWVVEAPTVSAR